jgi:DNA-binding NarL/FixJ family response regulator
LAGQNSSHAGSRMPAGPDSWRVILLTRDVSLDEAQNGALDLPRMRFSGTTQAAGFDRRPALPRPDLIVLDCTGADDHGLSLLVAGHRRWPDARVLLLGAPDDAPWLAKAVRFGVRGALPRDYNASQLGEAARHIHDGELWFSRRLTQEILSINLQEQRSLLLEHLAEAPELTDRERDVARHAVQGLSNREIARELALQEPAVQDLLQHAYRKLRAHRRSELILRLALGHRVEPADG